MIVPPTDPQLDDAAARLRLGELVAIPTETVYGLAANALDPVAVAKIFTAKGRPAINPLILHVATADHALRWVRPTDLPWWHRQWEIASSFWPGPMTIVTDKHPAIPDIVTAGQSTVGIRVPDHDVTLRLLARVPFPLAAPSANRSNYISPTRPEHVVDGLGDQVSMVIDGGPCRSGLESTILRLHPAGPQLLRPGVIGVEQLQDAFGTAMRTVVDEDRSTGPVGDSTHDAMASPGRMPLHYSPTTPLRLITQPQDPPIPAGRRIGRIHFGRRPHADASHADASYADASYAATWTLGGSGDPADIAAGLFAALRTADRSGCDEIWIDTCDEQGIGRAIMDRLRRAAAR